MIIFISSHAQLFPLLIPLNKVEFILHKNHYS